MKESTKILVVDDELGIRDLLSSELSSHNFSVRTASNGEEAVEMVKREKFHLIISDVKMPRMDGLSMLEAVKNIDPDVEIIMSTGYGTIETAVSAMKKGAYDFVQKPFNLEEILALVDKALEKNELKTLLGIYETSKAIFSSIKLDSLLPIVAKLSAQILRADDVSIILAGVDGRLLPAVAVGLDGEERKRSRLALGERASKGEAGFGEPLVLAGPPSKDPRFSGLAGIEDIRSSIIFPLVVEGQTLGVLNANRTARREPFTANELRHATIFGSQIAQALHNAKLYRELEKKIQEIQEMQIQLVQSEKLAAVGQLAAGVAHEINNPLTGILGFTEILLQSNGLSAQQREDLESVLHQSKRCREIVQNLLQFSRRRKPNKEAISLEKVLQPTLDLVQYDFRSANIEIRKSIPKDLPPIHGDPSQLEQVFLNIVTNARHAMEDKGGGGVLAIKASGGPAGIVIRFEDNGRGIAPEHIGKVFDPFFTTKAVGKGTGLGLSISYGIIQQHNGTIRVESTLGAGSAFIIELPASQGDPLGQPKEGVRAG